MIKAVIFDMMGPLLQKRPDYKVDNIVQTAESLSSQYLNTGQFINKLKSNAITKALSVDEIAGLVANKYCEKPEVWGELLPKLKQNYKLAVLNNGMSITIPHFKKQYPFNKFFSVFINSSEENFEKPNPNIYNLICGQLKVNPAECVFIDDTEANVEGAKKSA
jgi:HAD superfamily hydrolase (TIGR01509 family)